MEQGDGRKRCLKCLLREMDREAYMDNLYDYIRRLDEDIKADQALYEERLSVCKACDYLERYVQGVRVLRGAARGDTRQQMLL